MQGRLNSGMKRIICNAHMIQRASMSLLQVQGSRFFNLYSGICIAVHIIYTRVEAQVINAQLHATMYSFTYKPAYTQWAEILHMQGIALCTQFERGKNKEAIQFARRADVASGCALATTHFQLLCAQPTHTACTTISLSVLQLAADEVQLIQTRNWWSSPTFPSPLCGAVVDLALFHYT